MNAVYLYCADEGLLEREAIVHSLQSSSCSSELEFEPDEFALCTCRFEFEGESNIVEVKRSLQCVVLGREGKAAIKAAFDIQSTYPHLLSVTNESYDFEIQLRDHGSFQDLMACYLQLVGAIS